MTKRADAVGQGVIINTKGPRGRIVEWKPKQAGESGQCLETDPEFGQWGTN